MNAPAGQEVAEQNRSVEGMACYDCAQTIERAARRIDGVLQCTVSFPAARMKLEYDATNHDTPATVERVVHQLGYRLGPVMSQLAVPVTEDHDASEHERRSGWQRHTDTLVTVTAALATIAAALSDAFTDSTATQFLYAVAIVIGGFEIARAGFRALIATHRFDINLLMTIAVIGAVAIGALLEAALVVVLFRIGESLERFAVDRGRRSLHTLLRLTPDIAHRRISRGGTVEDTDVRASTLVVGDLVVVRPGERLPADGHIVDGASTIDQAPITGESLPVEASAGAVVFAGTINGEGPLVIEVSNEPGDSTIDRVARAVADAQAQRSPVERWVDQFARLYTPLVLCFAVIVTVVPPVVFDSGWSEWIYRGLAFLILACPCALVIATPVAVVAALSRAANAGVLIKGGAHLETATRLRAIAVDKTGTITEGRPLVTDVASVGHFTQHEVLGLAAAVERSSEHPLARAIVAAAAAAELAVQPASDFETTRGLGAAATIAARRVAVGSDRMLSDHLNAAARDIVDDFAGRGRTVVVVTVDGAIAGFLGLADRVRDGAAEALTAVRRLGIEHTVLLTGDHLRAAEAIAAEAGITDVRSDLLPADKVSAIAAIQRSFGATAMIGDGVNDAPALATAHLGIAMGGAGSPTAIETADVVLMGDDLRKVGGFLALARMTQRVVRQNISFSLGTKAIAAGFALVGLLPLWVAVLTDVGATLLVVVNGLRLMRSPIDPPLDRHRA